MHAVLVPVYLLLVTPITLSWCFDYRAAGVSHLVMDPEQMCKRARRVRGKMADICHNKKLGLQITDGIALGQIECQNQFKHRKWNCTSAKRSIKKVMLRDTRETGFVNAIIAAGVTYQVTRACSRGELPGCSCDRRMKYKNVNSKKRKQYGSPEGDWEWEGCGGENVNYGMKKSKDFLDTRHKNRSDVKNLVKLHNYIAGRLAIKNYMKTDCKCHGLSGSCTLKTCSRKMPLFSEVGSRLKERFDGAVKVTAGNDGVSFKPDGVTIKAPSKGDLVYLEESQDFCKPNHALGSFGTQGRLCNATSPGEEGCVILCCSRGYETRIEQKKTNCRCNFIWCCDVKCATCYNNITISTCK